MNQKTGKKEQLMGGIFTMLLFLVFVLSALFTVLTGSRVYENITVRSDRNFSGSTALSYIANKIRQGDQAGMVDVKEVEGKIEIFAEKRKNSITLYIRDNGIGMKKEEVEKAFEKGFTGTNGRVTEKKATGIKSIVAMSFCVPRSWGNMLSS